MVLLTLPTFAEVRLVNGTGKVLKIDVLSPASQVRDLELPTDRSLTDAVGGKLADSDYEMLVVKAPDGSELKREKVQANNIIAINNWGGGLTFTYAGRFAGRKNGGGFPLIINATGHQLNYRIEYQDFDVYEGKGRSLSDAHTVNLDQLGRTRNEGEEMKATFSAPGAQQLTEEIVAGRLYYLGLINGQLRLEKIW